MNHVYRYVFPDGSVYIGVTSKSLRARIGPHYQCVKRGSKSPLSTALRKFGDPHMEILSSHLDREEAYREERLQIALQETLNVQSGGPPSESLKGNQHLRGKLLSKDSRRRMSEAHKGNQHRKGSSHSPETKERIRQSMLARRGK